MRNNRFQTFAGVKFTGWEMGVAIEAISLDSAYHLSRGKHPGVDFRFVPSLEEIKTLLSSGRKILGNNLTIVDEVQHQLRKQPNSKRFTLLDYQKDCYFRGVPIYLVQLSEPLSFCGRRSILKIPAGAFLHVDSEFDIKMVGYLATR